MRFARPTSALVGLIALASAAPALAQSSTSDVYVQQATQALGMSPSDALGRSALGAVEALAALLPGVAPGANAVVTTQTGSDNAIVAEQTGVGNAAVLSQFGSGNRTQILQDGSRNLVVAFIAGDDNLVSANQFGDDNVYSLVMVGTNPEHVVNQIGDGNVANQFVAPGLQPAGIEQRGSGMEVVVERY